MDELDRATRLIAAREADERPRQGRGALVLHLSRLRPPAPRPHHCRIARAILDDAVHAQEGQVFAMRNADLVLLYRRADGVTILRDQLSRLFRLDAPDPEAFISLSTFADGLAALRDYAQARLQEAAQEVRAELPGSARVVDALRDLVHDADLTNFLRRQTAALIRPSDDEPVRPLYRRIAFNLTVLETRVAALGQAHADPFLFRHLASRLDLRVLTSLRDDLSHQGPLTSFSAGSALPLHLNLTVRGILSPEFAGFAAICRDLGAEVGVEVSLMEACGDPAGFALARDRLRLAGLHLVLDGVSHHALLLTLPAVLEPDLVKLDWSEHIPEAGQAVTAAIRRIGAARVVLRGAETPAAVSWGVANGLHRFEGGYVDTLLAAERMRVCPGAVRCRVRQCQERASATGPGGRSGCGNPAMLDQGGLRVAEGMPA